MHENITKCKQNSKQLVKVVIYCKFAKQRWRSLSLKDVRIKLLPCCSPLEILQEILELPLDESCYLLPCCGAAGLNGTRETMVKYVKLWTNSSLMYADMYMNGSSF
jgi:hypothetical protein